MILYALMNGDKEFYTEKEPSRRTKIIINAKLFSTKAKANAKLKPMGDQFAVVPIEIKVKEEKKAGAKNGAKKGNVGNRRSKTVT